MQLHGDCFTRSNSLARAPHWLGTSVFRYPTSRPPLIARGGWTETALGEPGFGPLAGPSTTRDNDTYRASPEGLIPPRRTAATHRQERTIVDPNQPPVAAKAVFPEQPISSIGIHHLVRHAYLLGQNDPYKALQTTLKAESNEAVWETLHSDTSRPFDKPESGRIG